MEGIYGQMCKTRNSTKCLLSAVDSILRSLLWTQFSSQFPKIYKTSDWTEIIREKTCVSLCSVFFSVVVVRKHGGAGARSQIPGLRGEHPQTWDWPQWLRRQQGAHCSWWVEVGSSVFSFVFVVAVIAADAERESIFPSAAGRSYDRNSLVSFRDRTSSPMWLSGSRTKHMRNLMLKPE